MNYCGAEALYGSQSSVRQEGSQMNTANLQLEGVYAVLAALLQTLLDKKVMTGEELGRLLTEVEGAIVADASRPSEVRTSNVEAMCFPIRFLKSSLHASSRGQRPSFAEVTSRIRATRDE
jgi:hypothetical protein